MADFVPLVAMLAAAGVASASLAAIAALIRNL